MIKCSKRSSTYPDLAYSSTRTWMGCHGGPVHSFAGSNNPRRLSQYGYPSRVMLWMDGAGAGAIGSHYHNKFRTPFAPSTVNYETGRFNHMERANIMYLDLHTGTRDMGWALDMTDAEIKDFLTAGL